MFKCYMFNIIILSSQSVCARFAFFAIVRRCCCLFTYSTQ